MKISVPWPIKESGQARIRESLSLWENKKDVVICCPVQTHDDFFEEYNYTILPRNSTDIGTSVPKCFIHDMVDVIVKLFPDEDWYGFGNSDCVPVGNILENSENHDILIFHRTDIKEWEDRFEPEEKDDLKDRVWKMRQKQSDKKVARQLNREEIPTPDGSVEWTYRLVEEYCEDQGCVFIHGQDLYLFRRDVVNQVLSNYLQIQDPILGTGAFDPRLTKWCMNNFKSARVLHKLFHKKHESEWNPDEVEFEHNGGVLTEQQWSSSFEDEFLIDLVNQGHRGSMSGWFTNAVKKYNKNLWEQLIGD